jgi:hypothetical protein
MIVLVCVWLRKEISRIDILFITIEMLLIAC